MSTLQVFVMGPIVVMARRPSLHIPVPPEDVQDELGHIQTIARISSFQSEMAGTAVLQGDPPQWVVQVRACVIIIVQVCNAIYLVLLCRRMA